MTHTLATPPGADAVIACDALTRWYGPVMGLVDVTCTIGPGITGLLGPNGAGKTTFIRSVTGQLRPSSGAVRVFGESPFANPSVLGRLGFCPDEDVVYEQLSALTMVTRLTQLHGFTAAESRDRAERALVKLGLEQDMGRAVSGFSKGMRQRVKIAQAIAHDPQLLILDEPLTGTDPIVRRDLQQAIKAFADDGGTVLVSSHILYEIEQLTSRVIVLYNNRLLADGEVRELREAMRDVPNRVRIECDRPRALARALFAATEVLGIDVDDTGCTASTRTPAELYGALTTLAAAEGIHVTSITADDLDLAAVFEYLTS
ncbi:MAG: ABC transporter ATP-binding protein [Planctomycetota bacterium]|jgi:ABC-2 type transport system ATP-binding protein